MPILTDSGGAQLTTNAGKVLVRDTGSIIDYGIAYDNSTYTLTPSLTDFTTEITNLIVTITPKSASSKFLLLGNLTISPDGGNFFSFNFRRYVSGNLLFPSDLGPTGGFANINTNGDTALPINIQHIDDTPNTTQTLQYRIGVKRSAGSIIINKRNSTNPTQSSIIVMEIV